MGFSMRTYASTEGRVRVSHPHTIIRFIVRSLDEQHGVTERAAAMTKTQMHPILATMQVLQEKNNVIQEQVADLLAIRQQN